MLISLVVFILIFLIMWEILTIIFEMTGVPEYKARFQSLTMMTTIGYSSKESEIIMQNTIRRKIAMFAIIYAYINNVALLMILINLSKTSITLNILFISFSIVLIILILIKNRSIIESRLKYYCMKNNWFSINKSNIYYLLSKNNKYGLYNIPVKPTFKFIGETIESAPLKELGIQVLNVDKGHKVEFTPSANYVIEIGDILLVYCNSNKIKECFIKLKINVKLKNNFKF